MRTVVANSMAYRHLGWAGALLLVVGAIGSGQALAAQPAATKSPVGITISPSLKDITINSGLITANTSVTLTNNSGARLIGTLRLLDIDTSQSTGFAFLNTNTSDSTPYRLANWLSLPNGETVNIADGQTITIPVVVDNRADLAPGGHYGAVVVAFGTPSPNPGATKADFKQQLASLLFVKKRGGERYGLELSELKALPTNKIPTTIIFKFLNSGNVHVAPLGYVTVAGPNGKVVAKGIINTDATLILPGKDKLLESTLQVVDKHVVSGRYTVSAHYRYDEAGSFSTKAIQFNYKNGPNVFVIGAVSALVLGSLFLLIWLKIRR